MTQRLTTSREQVDHGPGLNRDAIASVRALENLQVTVGVLGFEATTGVILNWFEELKQRAPTGGR